MTIALTTNIVSHKHLQRVALSGCGTKTDNNPTYHLARLDETRLMVPSVRKIVKIFIKHQYESPELDSSGENKDSNDQESNYVESTD